MPKPQTSQQKYSADFYEFFVGESYGCPVDRDGKLSIVFDKVSPTEATFRYASKSGEPSFDRAWANARGQYDQAHDTVDGSLLWNAETFTFRIFRDRAIPSGAAPRIHVYMRSKRGGPEEGEWVGHGGTISE